MPIPAVPSTCRMTCGRDTEWWTVEWMIGSAASAVVSRGTMRRTTRHCLRIYTEHLDACREIAREALGTYVPGTILLGNATQLNLREYVLWTVNRHTLISTIEVYGPRIHSFNRVTARKASLRSRVHVLCHQHLLVPGRFVLWSTRAPQLLQCSLPRVGRSRRGQR